MRIAIIGAGTVGKATGIGLRSYGHDIVFVDVSAEVVEGLSADGLDACSPDGFSLDGVDAVFVSVNTPAGEYGIDASALVEVTADLGRKLAVTDAEPLIVFRSTQPPGTTRNSLIPLLHRCSGKTVNQDFAVAYWPEYLRAKNAEEDFLNPRVVTISSLDRNDRSHRLAALLALDLESAVHWLPLEAAELQKYVNNVGNAVKISTYNFFRLLAEKIGIGADDIDHIMRLCTLSAEGLWNPGYGLRDYGPYGGACLPKDVVALTAFAKIVGMDTALLEAADQINRRICD